MDKFILAIDAGTTSSRAILFNKKAEILDIAQYEFNQIFPKEGWVEHDPVEIWNTQLKAIREVIQKSKIDPKDIDSIGITNQRETTVIWNKDTGQPVYNAIVWQDRRTAIFCDKLKEDNKSELIQNKTGLVIDAYFSATKIKWILDSNSDIREQANKGQLFFGTIDSWLIWNLSKGKYHITDPSNASRTLLYNIKDDIWDDQLLEIFDVPRIILPKVVDSSALSAYTDEEILGSKIPIAGIAGDQQAALFGQLCVNPGDVKNTYGTGCFCIMNTGISSVKSKNKMLSTIAWRINGELTYALEGSVFVAGALIQWLRDKMKFFSNAKDSESFLNGDGNSKNVHFLPAFNGLGAPYWNSDIRASYHGITRDTSKADMINAAFNSITYQTKDIIHCLSKIQIELKSLNVDGGMLT